MSRYKSRNSAKSQTKDSVSNRLKILRIGLCLFAGIIAFRLFTLQVIQGGFYSALASGQHRLYEELIPERGTVYIQDLKDGEIYPAATNVDMAFIYADPRHIEDPDDVAEDVGLILGYSDEEIEALEERLDQPEDPYEPIEQHVSEALLQEILALEYTGIGFIREPRRTYPEEGIGGHVLGFLGSNEDGSLSGRYGIEGHYEETLAGNYGYLESERDPYGRFIAIGDVAYEAAVDGADVVLTIDRNIQYTACSLLDNAVRRHSADGGSVVILNPNTGAVLAMCGSPDFDPNVYNEVSDITAYNNPVIFNAYEPGSIFKPITMSAALDSGSVTPSSTYVDEGVVQIDGFDIKNSDEEAHGQQTMTEVLEKSLNTGMIFAMREMGRDVFADYIELFDFGAISGIELDTEVAGTVASLDEYAEVYAVTASYGQGITVTTLQMAKAFAALANGGILLEPYIVDEIRHANGRVQEVEPLSIREVISDQTSRLISAMLISVVENGHGTRAGVDGYYIAGKTGTAQVARTDGVGYESGKTIGSFAGYGPVGDPKFAMVVRIDHPKDVPWAESTAAPLFGEIADFLLRYFEVPPQR